MMATICGRFRLELDPQMGGEAGVLARQISSFTLAVDGGLFLQFHDRTLVGKTFIITFFAPFPAALLLSLLHPS